MANESEPVLVPGEPVVVVHRDVPGDHVFTDRYSCWCRPVVGSALSDESLIPETEKCDG